MIRVLGFGSDLEWYWVCFCFLGFDSKWWIFFLFLFLLLSYYITFTDDVERDLNKIMLMDVCI